MDTSNIYLLLKVRSSNGIRRSHKHQPHHSLLVETRLLAKQCFLPSPYPFKSQLELLGIIPNHLGKWVILRNREPVFCQYLQISRDRIFASSRNISFILFFSFCRFITTPPRTISDFSLHLKNLQEDAFNFRTPKQGKGLVSLKERLFWPPWSKK